MLPGWQGNGLGSLILTSLVHRFMYLARRTSGGLVQATVGLGVLRPNVRALGWYQHLTFSEVQQADQPDGALRIGKHEIPRPELVANLTNVAIQLGFYGRPRSR